MALLVTSVLGDEVEVLAADDDGSVHLGRDNGAGKDTATDRNLAGEGALLVCRKILSTPARVPLQSSLSSCISRRISSQASRRVVSFAHTDVATLDGVLGGPESQSYVLVVSSAILSRAGSLDLGLRVEEDWSRS